LARIREKFLTPHAAGLADYWDSEDSLAAYHETFARRIAWKWDAVVESLRALPAEELPTEPFERVLDWGCGTGCAALSVSAGVPQTLVSPKAHYFLHDRSPRAMEFARARLEAAGRDGVILPSPRESVDRGTLVLVSHVLTELSAAQREELLGLLQGAGAVLWVEPGTPFCGSALVEAREKLRASGFTPLLPCRHSAACGMVSHAPEKNWCHFFAEPPREVFRDGEWVRLARELGIDLRALPVSYLFLRWGPVKRPQAEPLVVGRPRNFKGLSKLTLCLPGSVEDYDFQHRGDKSRARSLEENEFLRLFKLPSPRDFG
jgi:SAM-dependent methyltransferase